MLEWFTESSFVPAMTGVAMFIVFSIFAYTSRERSMLYIAAAFLLMTIGIVTIESLIVTEKEELQETVYQLAFQVQRNDLETVVAAFDQSDQELISRVRSEMPRYDFDTCRLIDFTSFASTGDDPDTAEIEFAVAVRLRQGGMPEILSGQRRVRLSYQKDAAGNWKIKDYQHFDPRGGVEL